MRSPPQKDPKSEILRSLRAACGEDMDMESVRLMGFGF